MVRLKFTPLEFETRVLNVFAQPIELLKFTPLEFETDIVEVVLYMLYGVKIYSVGV